MSRSRFIAWVVLAALVVPGVGVGGEPPAPPASDPPRVLEAGQQLYLASGELVTVPPDGGLYLSPPAFRYQLELRRFSELELQLCKDQVETTPPGGWKPWVVGGAAGAALGLVVGILVTRRTP